MKILVIGSINKDIVFDVENIVKDGQTISSTKQSEFIGGKGFNQAIALSNAYPNVYFYCNVNEDDTLILSHIQKYNFKSNYVQKVREQTGTAFIQVNSQGENAIVISKNANGKIDLDTVAEVVENFDSNDLIVLQNEINDIEYIISLCDKRGLQVALNPSPMGDINLNLIQKTKYLVVNKAEFLHLTDSTTVEEGITVFRGTNKKTHLIITLGEHGALHNYEVTTQVKGIKTKAVDTTCAGDTFLGYFIGSMCSGKSIKSSLQIANEAASLCVQTKGASNSIPTLDDIIKGTK